MESGLRLGQHSIAPTWPGEWAAVSMLRPAASSGSIPGCWQAGLRLEFTL